LLTLLLARHGETDWNRDRRWQGATGPPLNGVGRRQAAALAAEVGDLDAVYTSGSDRARETSRIVAEPLGVSVCVDSRLGEVDFGLWEGLTREEIDERFRSGFARWLAGEAREPEGGESDEAMAERVLQALREIAARHRDGRVLVVTSGGPIRAVEAHLHGIPAGEARRRLDTRPNCAVLELAVTGGDFESVKTVFAHPS
jgi:broad specificity phosphatase PhoE